MKGCQGFVAGSSSGNGNRNRRNVHMSAACHHTKGGLFISDAALLNMEYVTTHRQLWGMLTLDFLERQLLQAAAIRLRFKTGSSDMAVVTGALVKQAESAR